MSTINPITFFKALADPTRLRLILQLRACQSLCVCELTEQLAQPQPTVSRHLSHLRKHKLVTCERRGTWMWYAINPELPAWCLAVIYSIETNDAAAQTLPSSESPHDPVVSTSAIQSSHPKKNCC